MVFFVSISYFRCVCMTKTFCVKTLNRFVPVSRFFFLSFSSSFLLPPLFSFFLFFFSFFFSSSFSFLTAAAQRSKSVRNLYEWLVYRRAATALTQTCVLFYFIMFYTIARPLGRTLTSRIAFLYRHSGTFPKWHCLSSTSSKTITIHIRHTNLDHPSYKHQNIW